MVPKKRRNDNNAKEKGMNLQLLDCKYSDEHCAGLIFVVGSDGVTQDEEELTSPLDLCGDEDSDLTGAEQKQVGGLAWRVYQTYWVAVGGVLAASILMSLLLMQGLDRLLSFSAWSVYSGTQQMLSVM